MALDVSSIIGATPVPIDGLRSVQVLFPDAKPAIELPNDLKTLVRDLQRVSESYDRRLSFSLNEKLGQVVVKVIDNDTDKIVREIPPTELQHVYERIREVIGLLFDKSA